MWLQTGNMRDLVVTDLLCVLNTVMSVSWLSYASIGLQSYRYYWGNWVKGMQDLSVFVLQFLVNSNYLKIKRKVFLKEKVSLRQLLLCYGPRVRVV